MARLDARPMDLVDSSIEHANAQFLFDRGCYWQQKEYEASSYLP